MVSATAAAKTESVYQGGFQETDIGLIPSDWDVEELGNIGSAFIGLTYSPRDVHPDGTLVLRSSNVQNGRLRFDDNVYVKVEVPDRATVRENDILICVRNGSRDLIGKSAVIDAPSAGMAFGAFMGLYRSEHNNFLAHVFKSDIVMRQVHEHLGATINQITNKSLNGFKAPLPKSSDERKAIAEALNDADALIESLERLIAKKREIKQGAMQELLTGKRRLEGFQTSSDFKKTELGEIPEDWDLCSLGEIAKLYQSQTISADKFTESGYPVFGANGVVGYYSRYNHVKKQVTVTCRGSTCGTVNRTLEKSWITGNSMIVNCDENHNLDKEFLYYFLLYCDLTVCITGSGLPQIVRSSLSDYKISLPSLVEQNAIGKLLQVFDSEIFDLETYLIKAQQIKQGMMQELLTGRIRLV